MQYLCAGYDRLSDADNNTDESSSIQSQRLIIDSFAKFNNLNILKHYVDDGYSGGNFDRPAFQEMIRDIESGKINCIITKDLSRLGREMYKTGNYIEQYFLEKGVRYIAINDSFDSNIGDSMLGIRLGVNDLYLRDVSKKVRTSFRAKQNKGDYIGSIPLYGYKKDPDDRHKLIIDEDVVPIIELIYDLALEGITIQKIAETLTLRKIPIPVVHKNDYRAKDITENDSCGIWRRQTVKSILTSEMYIGNMVQNTFTKVSYNSKKLRKTREEEKIIVKGTHDAIIDKNKFDKVQKLLSEKTKKYKQNGVISEEQLNYLFGGLLYCKECGRTIRISKDVLKSGVTHYTQCNLYTRKGKYGICSSHRVNYDWLESDVIEYLQTICEDLCRKCDFNEVNDNSDSIILSKIEENNIKIKSLGRYIASTKATIDNLYVDKTKGLVDEDMYKRIYEKTKIELLKNETELETLNERQKSLKKQINPQSSIQHCKSSILKYMSLKEPKKEQIERLVNRIEIDKNRKVYVYLKFKELSV